MNADLKDACLFPATAQSVKNPTQDFGAAKRTTWCSSFRHIPIQEWTLHVPRCAFLLTDSWLNRQRKWHKYVTSCHENAAGQPLCRLRRRQQPHSKFLYLHILWQCGHQHLMADTTDIKDPWHWARAKGTKKEDPTQLCPCWCFWD